VRSLFFRIFLSYWAAQALFILVAVVITMTMRPQRDTSVWGAQYARALNEAVQAYAHGGQAEAQHFLENLEETQQIQAFLFNGQGEELSRRAPREWAHHIFHDGESREDGFLGRLMPKRFVRQSMTAADGHHYVLLVALPRGPRIFFGPHGIPGLGFLLAVVCSGLVSYVLARSLTAPVVRLRTATRQLAAGDLSARAGGAGSRRKDELAELVRDFDTMAERLENLVNAQAHLLNDISHELRSPLARLNVALGLARQRTGPEAQAALERIDLEAARLNELIGRLLTIARLEGGEEAMQKFPIALEELVQEVAKDADFEAQARDCRVEAIIVDDCMVMGDPSLLHSALENVMRNATRYTRPGSAVEVRLERGQGTRGPAAVVRVADSGPGVPDEALDKLFRPFYRIDDARGRQTGGVGLGLAITDRAVRLHGGTVRAANRAEGGLIIEIRLPLVESANATPELEPAGTAGA
jgi:two-component system sensor histidine kinase CpxA